MLVTPTQFRCLQFLVHKQFRFQQRNSPLRSTFVIHSCSSKSPSDSMETESKSPARVVVCGAGVIGVCTAYFLSKKGASVTLIEKSSIACAASGKAGGFLALDWCDGGPVSSLARASFNLHRKLADELNGPEVYGYRPVTTLSLSVTEPASSVGTSYKSPVSSIPSWVNGPAKSPKIIGTTETTAQVHPQLFTKTLIKKAVEEYGVTVVIGKVEEVVVAEGKARAVILEGGNQIEADAVVLALGPWTSNLSLLGSIFRVSGLKAHSIVLEPNEPNAITPHALFLSYYPAQGGKPMDPEVYPRPTVGIRERKRWKMSTAPPTDQTPPVSEDTAAPPPSTTGGSVAQQVTHTQVSSGSVINTQIPSSSMFSFSIPSPSFPGSFSLPASFPFLSSYMTAPAILRAPTSPFSTSPLAAPFGGNLTQTCHVKLDRNNFLLWKYTVLPVIRGHKLENHLFGNEIPPRLLPGLGGYGSQPNPAFTEWETMDQLLLGWLTGSMTEQALMEVVGCNMAAEVWQTLETLFNSQAQSRILEYKDALTKTEKGGKSMSDYLALMKSYSDNLAAAGCPLPNSELILATLGGLSRDYESVIVNITSRVASLSWPEVKAQLLTHERMLMRFNSSSSTVDLGGPMANAAYTQTSAGRGGTRFPANNTSQGRGRNTSSRGGRGRGRSRGGRTGSNSSTNSTSGNSGPRPVCQICMKPGHTAIECWHRFESDYGESSSNQSNAKQVSAYLASADTVADPSWYLDSGATNHVTSDLNNLSLRTPYDGSDSLVIGNGQNHQDYPAGRTS